MGRRHRGDGGLYQRADGLWCGQVDLGWVDGKRRRRTIYDRDHDRAHKKLEAAKRERDAGIRETTHPTVEKWLKTWLEYRAQKVKPRTLRTYQTYVDCYLVPAIGRKRIDRLGPQHLTELDRFMAGKSSTTRLHAYRVLGNALELARKRRMIQWNIVSDLEDNLPRRRESQRKGLTAVQARKVLAAATDPRTASRWWAALLTGARQGELLGLRWDYVDLQAGVIDLAWALQSVPYSHGCNPPCGKTRAASCPQKVCVIPDGIPHEHLRGNLYLMPPKTKGSRRVVPLLPAMVAALKLHRKATAGEPNPHDLVWHHPDGRPLDGRRDWEAWKRLLSAAKVPDVALHEARNTTATLLLEAKVDPHVISAILGHSDVVVTRGYQTVSLEMARKAVETLGERLAL